MPAAYIQANTNGRLHSAAEPSLSPLNRGFLYGDAIYEVWRTYHGVIFAWHEHWLRLERSASALHLRLPWSQAQILEQVRRTVTAFRAAVADAGELYVRLQIARGEGSIGLDPALADEPMFVLLVQRVPQLSPAALETGLRLTVATSLRRNDVSTLNPAWKTGNYLNNLLCLHEARSRGADEVLIANLAGEITEAAVCNVVFLDGRRLVSPPTSSGILAGVTRHLIAGEIAARAGLEWSEEVVRSDDFVRFQECALLSTTKDVQPVSAIDDCSFRVHANSTLRRLKAAFAGYTADYARAHPELAL